jgi:glycosyltransferase involved in cell wall biosynthesis
MNVGLGNNGGSLTIIKSANELYKLGHDVFIIDTMKNKCSWESLLTPHIICKNNSDIPNADIIIATGFKSWKHTINLNYNHGKKYVWVRGWEIWNSSESNIINILSNNNIIKIVNSICLQNKLKTFNINSTIIRPGNDLNIYYPMNLRDKKNIIIGGLYHTKHKTKRSNWILKTIQKLKKKYNNIKLYMIGSNKNPNIQIIDKYISQPNNKEKNIFFNNIDIWLAPSNLEGLHIIPQEAMLTECPVITTNALMSGTQDYIDHNINGYISENNINSFINFVDKLYNEKNKRIKFGKNARNKIISLGDRKYNMKKLVDFLLCK